MIECLKIEDFVITQMFRPYMPSLLPGEFQGLEYCEEQEKIERKLRSHPECIIDILEKAPETKQRIFARLRTFGGVKFYRYLDMSNPVIQYVKKVLGEEMFSEIEKEAMNKAADISDEIETKEYIKALLQAFPNSMINSSFEFIADIKTNQYFRLEDCKKPLDVDCKVLERLSRAAFKTAPYRNEWRNKKYHEYMLHCINDFFDTDFSEEDMELIYTKLGNGCNRPLCEEFVMSGYDMEVLK